MGDIMCASVAKVFEEIYVLRVDRYWNLCFHGSFRTPFRPGWYKVLQKNLFRYLREKWIFISFLGWDYIIISLYRFIRRTNAMQWYGSNKTKFICSIHSTPGPTQIWKNYFLPEHTHSPLTHYASTAADNLLAAARVECPGSTDRSSVTQNPSPTAAKFTAKPHILLDTLKKRVSNNFTRSF